MADIINLEAQLITGMGTQQALYQVPNSSMIVLQDLINATWNEGITTKEEFETKIANARTQAQEVMSKVAQYNNSTELDAAAKNQMSDLTLIEDRLKAMLAEAQAIAQMTTAMFNNLNVQASLRADGGTTVSTSSTY